MKKRSLWMLAALTALLCCLLTVSVSAATVASGTCGANGSNATWMLDDAGTLTISGSGPMKNYPYGTTPWDSYAFQIEQAIISPGITSIGDYAFSWCSDLVSVSIPESVTYIGIEAFYGCTSLPSLTLPKGLTGLGEGVFDWCTDLTSISIPDGVSLIPEMAFFGCTSLKSIDLGKGVKEIGISAFYHCSALETISFPSSLTTISAFAFESCTSLSSVYIPKNVSCIESAAFTRTQLSSITVDENNSEYLSVDGVLYDKDMFRLLQYPGGKNESSFTIPAKVYHVDYCAFSGCKFLTSILVEEGHRYYSSVDGVLFDRDQTSLIQYPIGRSAACYTVPDSVETLRSDCFTDCPALESVILGKNVTSLEFAAFSGCTSLKSITLGGSVQMLGTLVFENCTALESITIPASVTEIESSVFSGCTSLTTVNFLGDAPEISRFSFEGITTTCYYPADNATWTAGKLQNYGGKLTWKPAVVAKPVITASPKIVNTTSTGKAVFSVTATGEGLSYQWQYRKNSSDTWKSATASGSKTNTLTLDPAGTTRNGYQYRCKVTNAGGTVYSGYATLVIQTVSKPVITASPKRVNTTSTGKAVFSVTATGEGLSYQWQYRKNSSDSWKSATASGSKTATLTLNPAGTTRNGYQYRCKVTNAGGTVYSGYATLVITAKPVITAQPKSVTVGAADSVTFSVTATGATSYQWQYKVPGSTKWLNNTCTDSTFTINPAKAFRNGYQYRCVVTGAGGTTYSSAATLTVQ